MIAQDKRDKAMEDLLASMYDLYDFVVKADRLPEIGDRRTKLLRDMSLRVYLVSASSSAWNRI